jgi:CDP-diacylglycerol--glycerol-3-phosphate 3-phosphatidyltransferase
MTDERPKRKPLITANHVTLARLIPMPLIAWWIYAGHLRTAMIVGTIIACTDFIDGYMARRQGPTVLGGLLDPIADKVFIALIYMAFADLDVIPAWACALMFVREFLVTALRSAYEQRGLSMKTSYLAKVKTWTQMQGIGTLLLFPMVSHRAMLWVLIAGVVIPLVAFAVYWAIKRRPWKGVWVMSGSFAALLAVHLQHRPDWTFWFIMLMVLSLTWVSGLDYLAGAWKNLRGRGDFRMADAVRVGGSVALPVMLFVVAEYGATHVWPLLLILALELAVGGLDNLLSHHKQAANARLWGARVGGVCALLGVSLLFPDYATFICVSAAALSTAGVAWEFWRGRNYYLDARLRDKSPDLARAALLRPQSSG